MIVFIIILIVAFIVMVISACSDKEDNTIGTIAATIFALICGAAPYLLGLAVLIAIIRSCS